MTTDTIPDPEPVPVAVAVARYMRDIDVIAKDDQTAATGKYMYRGVDRVMNECGPVLRKHGVLVIPRVLSIQHRDVTTSGGKGAHEVIVETEFTFHGPMGDTIVGSAFGESADTSDKATAQAMSVALRTFYLQAFCIPTGDTDPDEQEIARSGRSQGSVKRPETSTADAIAKEQGWESAKARADAWDALLTAQGSLDDDFKAKLIEWGRGEKLDPDKFTLAQATRWQELLDEARSSIASATEKGEAMVEAGFATDPEAPFETEAEAQARREAEQTRQKAEAAQPDTGF